MSSEQTGGGQLTHLSFARSTNSRRSAVWHLAAERPSGGAGGESSAVLCACIHAGEVSPPLAPLIIV